MTDLELLEMARAEGFNAAMIITTKWNDDDSSNDVELTAEEVLDDYFQVNSFTGATKNGELPMWMGMLTPTSGRYTLHDITTGHLCADTPAYARAYMKGYVTVNGHEIAIYCVHLQPSSRRPWQSRDPSAGLYGAD